MDFKIALTTFAVLFLAELGDKTQLSVLTLAASTKKPWSVFAGGALALVIVTALGAFFGGFITRWVAPKILEKGAAALFVGIGLWMWFRK